MSAHTAGRLIYEVEVVRFGDDWTGVYTEDPDAPHKMPAMCYGPDQVANAAHICECWNAMEGIENPAAHGAMVAAALAPDPAVQALVKVAREAHDLLDNLHVTEVRRLKTRGTTTALRKALAPFAREATP